MNDTTRTARNHGLDTLRALAIMFVFMYHYTIFVSHDDIFGFVSEIGWVGVDLFFALSGYLIGNQIFAAMCSERAFSLPHFYGRRLLRTLPNFYVVLALYYLWPGFRGDSELLPVWKLLSFTANYQLNPGTAFSHAWSLCIEEQFYMLLPALALLIAHISRSVRGAWCALAVGVLAGLLIRTQVWQQLVDGNARGQYNFYKFIYYSSFCRLDELLAGVALALLKNYHRALWARLTAHGNLTLALGVAWCTVTFLLLIDDAYGKPMAVLGYPMLAIGFGLLVLAALSADSLLRRVRVPGAASLAAWSYAIYLLHKPVCMLVSVQLARFGIGVSSGAGVIVMSVLSVLAGYLLYRLVETPFMLLRARVLPSNHAAPRGALMDPIR